MLGELLATKSLISAALTPAGKEKSAASKRGLTSVKKEKEILPPRKSARIAGGKVLIKKKYFFRMTSSKHFCFSLRCKCTFYVQYEFI